MSAAVTSGYPKPYYDAWDAMVATGRYWGMAPIHHGVFENAWKSALESAARLAAHDPALAAEIRALGVYTEAAEQAELDAEAER